MLRSQVDTPIYRELERVAFSSGLFQNLDSFRIRQTDEIVFQHSLQTFDQTLIEHIVQEFDIIHTVVQSPLYTILDELFRQLHIVQDIIESHFRLDHPELGQVARRIGVFRTESRTECINLSQSRSRQFTFQLSGNGQARLFTEEIVIINDRSVFILLQIIEVHGRHLEHLTRTFTVGSCDQRCMEIEEPSVMEKFMNGISHVMTNTEYRTECIRTWTEMSDLTQELHRMAFFLQRISIRIGRTVNFYFSSLDLHILAFSLRLHQRTVYTDTRTCCYRLQKFFAQLVHVYNDLNIIYCRTVIQGYETNLFTTTAGTDPSFHVNGRTESFAFQYVYNFCSFNCFHVYIFILR